MSKSKKVTILLILALICAIISGIAIYYYCNSTKGFIYIFNADYSAGTRITDDMFTTMKVDEKIIDAGKNSSIETYYITGDDYQKVISATEYLLNDVKQNQPLTFTDLAYTSGTSIERALGSDMMAVTIPISGAAAVTDDLRVGSIVNIFTTSATETKMIFQNMKIIDITGDNSVESVTFETNIEDTVKLINAANNESLYFALVQPVEDSEAETGAVDDSTSSVNDTVASMLSSNSQASADTTTSSDTVSSTESGSNSN